jgi:hypothetical protein
VRPPGHTLSLTHTDVNIACVTTYGTGDVFFLASPTLQCYNTGIREIRRSKGPGGLKKMIMKRFYDEVWLPFVASKRPILMLAIATYMALC